VNKKYLFIVNPIAGKGKTGKLIDTLRMLINNNKLDYKILKTVSRGHIDSIIEENKQIFDRFIIVGGDGTAHDLINSKSITDVICGIIPTGSGNDYAMTLKMKKSLEENLEVILKDNVSHLDIGFAEIENQDGRKLIAKFANSIGIGFDAAVAAGAQSITFISGLPLYLLSVFKNVISYQMTHFTVDADDFKYSDIAFMLAVGIGKTAGGGFRLTPDAEADDGLLDFCLIKKVNKLEAVINLLPRAIIGKHINSFRVIYRKSSKLSVSIKSPLYVHADGEILTNNLKELKISILQKKLRIISNWS